MFDPDNPLTARVFVNRVWQMHFGRGLVKTAEDFGNQGDLPTHPELLDWLANYFIESGWDIKALHRLILTSKTYQQQSNMTPQLLEADPENLWLARGPRFRLPAEMVRDNALAISGLLVDKRGGASVYPYQPAGVWDGLTNKKWAYPYLQKPGEGLYRRSLYTIWKRTAPPPSMLIFDIADRGVCTVRRKTTSTPLQALVLLNDPQFVEAARHFAERIIREGGRSDAERLQYGFRMAVSRLPSESEQTVLHKVLTNALSKYEANPDAAIAILAVGESKRDEALSPSHHAAWTIVASTIMNLDETLTRE